VVVRGKNAGTSAKDVAEKVMKEVGPSLGVRVHEVKPLRDGGVIIRTPSLAEREKLTTNDKFAEVGLSVAVNEGPKPRAVVQGLHKHISCDDFIAELYAHNLKDKMTQEEFKSDLRVVTKPWEADDGVVNVVLEGTAAAIDYLLQRETCYIKWFYLKVRSFDPVVACFRCLGFDHKLGQCKAPSAVCRRCGQSGHRSRECYNALNCRNCAFRGRPSEHLMMSLACPEYATMVARREAKH
jgi:hypothetical protein